MTFKKTYIILSGLLILFLSACKDTNEGNEPENSGYEAPAAPATINQNNIITLEFFSLLTEESLFSDGNYQDVAAHVSANKTPLAFFFDRSDATIGQKAPVTDIALQSKLKSFFVQNNISNTHIEGTGIIVRSLVPVYDGYGIADSLYMAGCTIAAPLTSPVVVTLMTCKLSDKSCFPVLARLLGDGLKTNRIVLGTVKSTQADDFKTYLKYHMKDFRLSVYSSTGSAKPYSLFCLTPLTFVTREISGSSAGSFPFYQYKIEMINN
jgi:hypothetical protein